MDDKKLFDDMTDDELRNEFNNLRSQIVKKCNGCVKSFVDKEESDHCDGWTNTKCIWECNGNAKELVEEARKISDHFALTEEEINKISRTLAFNRSENSKIMKNILETNPQADDNGLVKETMEVSIDPYTGKVDKATPISEEPEDTYKMEELIYGNVRPTFTETSVKQIADTYGIRKEDAYRVLKLIRSKETKGLYEKLPLAMRNFVDNIMQDGSTRDEEAKNLLMQFQSDIEINEQMVDLDKSIKSSFDDAAKEIGNMEFTHTKDIFVNKMREEADKIVEEANALEDESDKITKIDQANKIYNVSNAYIESYHYKKQLVYLSTISQKNKRKIADISKYNSVINAFNERYRFNTRNIKDIRMVLPILYRKLHPVYKWVTEDLLKSFIMLTCISCDKMQPENINEHTYMFYTVQNLACLDFVDGTMKEEWSFAKEILNNVLYVLDILRDITKKKKDIEIDPGTGLPIIPDMLNNQLK